MAQFKIEFYMRDYEQHFLLKELDWMVEWYVEMDSRSKRTIPVERDRPGIRRRHSASPKTRCQCWGSMISWKWACVRHTEGCIYQKILTDHHTFTLMKKYMPAKSWVGFQGIIFFGLNQNGRCVEGYGHKLISVVASWVSLVNLQINLW